MNRTSSQTLELKSLGSKSLARGVAKKMFVASKAYRGLLERDFQIKKETQLAKFPWENLPILTKKSFYEVFPWREIVPRESYKDIYSVIRSSGSTNKDGSPGGFFWPQLKSQDFRMGPVMQKVIIDTFDLTRRKTLAIVGLSLGSWAGGEQFSFQFKSLALVSKFPLVVFSPGNQHREIIEIIQKGHEEFDQILISLCPSAIFYLERLAVEMGYHLPIEKITYIVTGEPFPEELRMDLAKRSGHGAAQLTILSLYGSADTGMLGFESLPLIKMRQTLVMLPDLAEKFGFSSRSIPNLYHAQTGESYLEAVDDELVITKWQGLPLIRYNLQDKVKLFSWKVACETIARAFESDPIKSKIWKTFSKMELPDVVSVSGRTQGCVFLCGSNIFESMLQEAFLRSRIKDVSTGTFVAWTQVLSGQQILSWQVELKKGQTAPSGADLENLHEEFVRLVSEQQPEFAEDYEKFYRPFEKSGLRIFRFHFCEAPHLSSHPRFANAIKRKILLEHGPV